MKLILFKNLFKLRQRRLAVYRLLTSSVLSTTSKQCFEQPTASFLVCSLIFIEYKLKNILEGVGSLHQEGLWSSKQSEIIQQHLSTLDGIVLAHLFGSEILKRMGVSLNQYRLSHFEIKSGIKAIEELVNLKLE